MDKDRNPRRRAHTSHHAHNGNAQWDGDEGSGAQADRLIEYTDAVLAGLPPEDELPPALASAVQALAARAERAQDAGALAPARHRRLKAEIMAAWDAAHTPGWARVRRTVEAHLRVVVHAFNRQPAWRAAAALLVLAFGMLLLVPLGAVPTPGTAAGPLGAGVWVGLGAVTVAAAVVIWVVGRRGR